MNEARCICIYIELDKSYISLIFYKGNLSTMNSNIVIKKQRASERRSSPAQRSESFYSLVDKPYYVEAIHYKMNK
jgi:hypothetical protein